MRCPSCDEDFEPQVTHCPYCGAPSPEPVRAEPGAPDEEDLGPLVAFHEAWDAAALARVTAALEARGIPFLVQGQSSFHSLGISGLLRGEDALIESQQILVPESLLPEAAKVLDELVSE